ncbi:Rrf2 family transcriptional regulator [Paenibacillus sp. CAU 1782]
MKISSRFSIAVHILSLLASERDAHSTSEWFADSVGTNPVIIRRILGYLKKSGLVNVRAGAGGAFLLKELEDITLLDVYRSVEVVDEGELFHIHDEPNPNCPIGANIQTVLDVIVRKAQQGMESILEGITMSDVVFDLSEQINK